MLKRSILISFSVLFLASCSDDISSDPKTCGQGLALDVIKDSLVEPTSYPNDTHGQGYCLSNEQCVNTYTIEDGKLEINPLKFACSPVKQGHLICNGNEIDALTDDENCGACGVKCKNGTCNNGVCTNNCQTGEIQCTDDTLQICEDDGWHNLWVCSAGCENNTCIKDSDSDGVPDSEDVCAYNGKYYENVDESTCANFDEDTKTYHIYAAQNLVDLYNKLNPKDNTNPIKINKIIFENDINLADLDNTPKNDECKININSWKGAISLDQVNIDGKNPKIIARRLSDGARCTLPHSLFDTLEYSSVNNLDIDLDVDSDDAKSILANTIIMNTSSEGYGVVSNITLSGSLKTTASTDTETGVGALAGTVYCYSCNYSYERDEAMIFNTKLNNITVSAPNADNVGGMIGYLDNVTINFGSEPHYIKSVTGNDYVGGIIGKSVSDVVYPSKNDEIVTDKEPSKFIINSVSGNNYVGGFGGVTQLSNTIIVTGSVEGDGDYIGGYIGSPVGRKNYYTDVNLKKIASSCDHISGNKYVGGISGAFERYGHTMDSIVNKVNKISANQFAGGLIGISSGYAISLSNTTSTVNSIVVNNADTPNGENTLSVVNGIGSFYKNGRVTFTAITSCSNIRADNEDTVMYGIGDFTNTSSFLFSKVVSVSKRYIQSSNEILSPIQTHSFSNYNPNNDSNNDTTSKNNTTYELNYYSITQAGEHPFEDTEFKNDNVIGFTSDEAQSVVTALGEGWKLGVCNILNEDGTTSEFNMPVLEQKELNEKLEELEQYAKDNKLIEVN